MAVMFQGLARRLSWPYIGEVFRSLLGVLLTILAAVYLAAGSDPAGTAIAAGGSAAIAGATALQDSPHGRLPLVLGVSFGMGAAVLLGSLTAAHGALFTGVDWSTERVMEQTCAILRAEGLSYALLACLWDVDTPADYENLIRAFGGADARTRNRVSR